MKISHFPVVKPVIVSAVIAEIGHHLKLHFKSTGGQSVVLLGYCHFILRLKIRIKQVDHSEAEKLHYYPQRKLSLMLFQIMLHHFAVAVGVYESLYFIYKALVLMYMAEGVGVKIPGGAVAYGVIVGAVSAECYFYFLQHLYQKVSQSAVKIVNPHHLSELRSLAVLSVLLQKKRKIMSQTEIVYIREGLLGELLVLNDTAALTKLFNLLLHGGWELFLVRLLGRLFLIAAFSASFYLIPFKGIFRFLPVYILSVSFIVVVFIALAHDYHLIVLLIRLVYRKNVFYIGADYSVFITARFFIPFKCHFHYKRHKIGDFKKIIISVFREKIIYYST